MHVDGRFIRTRRARSSCFGGVAIRLLGLAGVVAAPCAIGCASDPASAPTGGDEPGEANSLGSGNGGDVDAGDRDAGDVAMDSGSRGSSDGAALPDAVTLPSGNSWYVAPSGSASGDGSSAKPWDIVTALNGPPAVKPGDTIWLRAG
jgi:hypothetical protein